MNVTAVQVDGRLVRGPHKVIASQPVVIEQVGPPAVPGFKAIAGGVAAGTAANYAWKGFQVTNTITADELGKLLVKNGLAQKHVPTVADAALEVIRSEPTKVLLVAVSAAGAAWAALAAGSKFFGLQTSTLQRLAVSLLVAVLAAVAYYFLRQRGYLQ